MWELRSWRLNFSSGRELGGGEQPRGAALYASNVLEASSFFMHAEAPAAWSRWCEATPGRQSKCHRWRPEQRYGGCDRGKHEI